MKGKIWGCALSFCPTTPPGLYSFCWSHISFFLFKIKKHENVLFSLSLFMKSRSHILVVCKIVPELLVQMIFGSQFSFPFSVVSKVKYSWKRKLWIFQFSFLRRTSFCSFGFRPRKLFEKSGHSDTLWLIEYCSFQVGKVENVFVNFQGSLFMLRWL